MTIPRMMRMLCRKDIIMKKKILSLILCAVMLFCAVSCANPPGEGSGTRIDPGASISKDTTPVAESAPEAEPVDFSVLTEEELGKIDRYLLESIKDLSADSSIIVNVGFKNILTKEERTSLTDKQYEANLERSAEIKSEIKELTAQKNAILSNKEQLQDETIAEIDSRISALEEENKYLGEYNHALNMVFENVCASFIKTFITEHFSEKIDTVNILGNSMTAYSFVTTPRELLSVVGYEEIEYVYISPQRRESAFGFQMQLDASEEETIIEDASRLSNLKMYETYYILDGRDAINAGYDGDGVTVGMVENGSPDINEQYDVACTLALCRY